MITICISCCRGPSLENQTYMRDSSDFFGKQAAGLKYFLAAAVHLLKIEHVATFE